jgi:hypothetical protein
MERNARPRRSQGAMVQQTAANVGGKDRSQRTQPISAELAGRAELATGSQPKAGRSNTRQRNDRSSGKPCGHSRSRSRDHAGQHQRMDSVGASPSGTTGSSSSNSATLGTSQGSASSTSVEPSYRHHQHHRALQAPPPPEPQARAQVWVRQPSTTANAHAKVPTPSSRLSIAPNLPPSSQGALIEHAQPSTTGRPQVLHLGGRRRRQQRHQPDHPHSRHRRNR